jgi:FkbM family methyltransferase
MTIREIAQGKLYAAQSLWWMGRHLNNWADVWRAYRQGDPAPALEFRRGFTLSGGKWDDPIVMLKEVYGERIYRHGLRSKPEGVVLDVGANIGAVAMDFADRWGLEIHAYEPNPGTFQSLQRNITESHFADRVVLFNEAVAGHVGSFEMWTELMSVAASGYSPEPPSGAKQVSVACVDLATVFRRVDGRTIFLLKIDAEGAEADILENASGLSFDRVRHVAVECHETLRPGAMAICRGVLDKQGFQCDTRPVAEHNGIHMLYGWKK